MLPLLLALHNEVAAASGPVAQPPESRVFSGKMARIWEQDRWGISADLWTGYQGISFNGVPETFLGAVLGHSAGPLRLSASFAYSHSEMSAERSGSASLTALFDTQKRLQLGVDARLLMDLQLADDDSPGEREFQVVSGPVVTLPLGPTQFSATGGLEAQRYRWQSQLLQGPFVHFNLDLSF